MIRDFARQSGYACNPKFETDGEAFLGEIEYVFYRPL